MSQINLAVADRESQIGLAAGLGAFGLWGFAPLYFKLLDNLNAVEIIVHRIVWSVIFLAIVLIFRHKSNLVNHLKVSKRTLGILLCTGLLIALNWLIFVVAVNTDRVLSTSLGYYINPLVSVALGLLVFNERLNGLQTLAVALAGVGTLYLTLALGEFPWIAMSLAVTFGIYGMLRKQLDVGPMVGLFWETLLVLPFALGWLIWAVYQDALAAEFGQSGESLILMGTGLMTVMPLILFAASVKRLNLTTIGLMQYISPTISFSLAVFLFEEPFGRDHAVTFVCIWSGLCLYTYSSWKNRVRL